MQYFVFVILIKRGRCSHLHAFAVHRAEGSKNQRCRHGLIGVPWDGGTTNRSGPRHGLRQLRDMSTMMRAQSGATGVRPFEAANCADLGDIAPKPADLIDTMAWVTVFYDDVKDAGIRPLTTGGDHLTSLPVLRAFAKNRPLSMIHFDSHTDLFNSYFGGTKYTYGTPFRRAAEE